MCWYVLTFLTKAKLSSTTVFVADIIKAPTPSITCTFYLVKWRVSDTSTGKKSCEIHITPKVARHDNFSEMDKRGAKKRTRVILLWWGGAGLGWRWRGVKEAVRNFQPPKAEQRCVCVCACMIVCACVCLCARERERERWHIMRCKKKPTLCIVLTTK